MKKLFSIALISVGLETFASADTFNLHQGWNLVGSSNSIDLSKDFNDSNISIIWRYKNGQWQYFTSSDAIKSQIGNKYTLFTKTSPNEGFWVLSNNNQNNENQNNVSALTVQEKEALEYMYQEEKLAKDVYSVLGNMYPDLKVFNNIYNAEITHEKSVDNVLQHYNIPLPVKFNEVGKFKNPELQNLYNELIAKGEKSKIDALEVGIMVEVTDVEDLDKYLKDATSPDVIALFKFLRAGSYDHYNAFNKSLITLTGKGACELMDSKWCKDYPSQQGIETDYKDYYWFDGEVGGYRGK